MELEGKINAVMPASSGVSQRTGNAWMSQEYVMAYYWFPNQTQPSYIVLRVFGEDRIKQFNLQPNDEVVVRFHCDAHESGGRWYNELRIDNVKFIGASANKNQQTSTQPAQAANGAQADNKPQAQTEAPTGGENAENGEQENDGLPF